MTLPISYFRFYFPEYVLKTRLPPNCATGFLDSLREIGISGLSQLVEKPCLKEKSPFLQGEYEGAKPASNEIECLQKACVSRRLRRAAAAFRAAARAEKRGIVKAVEKVQHIQYTPDRNQ